MKKLAVLLGAVSTQALAVTPQQFYRAKSGVNLIQVAQKMETHISKKQGEYEEELAETNIDIFLSRGVSDNLALGLKGGNKNLNGGGGIKDISLFAQGQYKKFFYEFDLAFSGDIELDGDGTPNNGRSGGTNSTLTLGYGFLDNAGVRLDYKPGYTSVAKPKTGNSIETSVGATQRIQFYYEYTYKAHVLGAALGQLKLVPDTKDSDYDQKYTTLEFYSVHTLHASLDLTAGLRYWKGEQSKYDTLNIKGFDLGLRYRF